jgi:hypothetical protein
MLAGLSIVGSSSSPAPSATPVPYLKPFKPDPVVRPSSAAVIRPSTFGTPPAADPTPKAKNCAGLQCDALAAEPSIYCTRCKINGARIQSFEDRNIMGNVNRKNALYKETLAKSVTDKDHMTVMRQAFDTIVASPRFAEKVADLSTLFHHGMALGSNAIADKALTTEAATKLHTLLLTYQASDRKFAAEFCEQLLQSANDKLDKADRSFVTSVATMVTGPLAGPFVAAASAASGASGFGATMFNQAASLGQSGAKAAVDYGASKLAKPTPPPATAASSVPMPASTGTLDKIGTTINNGANYLSGVRKDPFTTARALGAYFIGLTAPSASDALIFKEFGDGLKTLAKL